MVEFVNKPGIMGQDDMGRTIASAVKTVAEDRLAPARVKQLELMMQRGAFEEAEKQKKRIAQKLAFGPDPMLGDYNPGRDVKGNVYDKRGAPLRMLANKEDFYDMVKEHQKQARKAVAKIGAPLGMAAAAGEAAKMKAAQKGLGFLMNPYLAALMGLFAPTQMGDGTLYSPEEMQKMYEHRQRELALSGPLAF